MVFARFSKLAKLVKLNNETVDLLNQTSTKSVAMYMLI